MPNSLLLTLLTKEPAKLPMAYAKKGPITRQSHPTLNISSDAKKNITEICEAIDTEPPTPNLKKDVARQELYDTLYSIIEKEYDESKKDPEKDKDNLTLNKAIAMALETAIKEASDREAQGEDVTKDPIIILRNTLREKIIAALTPKPLPA